MAFYFIFINLERDDFMKISENYSIKKITFIVSFIVFLFMMLISSYIFYQKKKSLEYHVYQTGKNYLQITSDALEVWISEQLKLAQVLASDPRVVNAAKNPKDEKIVGEAHDFLKAVHERYPQYENLPILVFTDTDFEINYNGEKKTIKNGTILTDTVEGKTIGKAGMKYNFVEEIYKGKEFFISKVYPSIFRGHPIFVLTVPVIDKGKLIGVIAVSPKMDFFTNIFLDKLKHGETGYTALFDDRWVTIAHPDNSLILNDSKEVKLRLKSIVQNMMEKNIFFKTKFNGIDKYYVIEKISLKEENTANTWYLIFAQNEEEVLSPAYKTLKVSILISLVVTLAAGFFTSFLGENHINFIEKEVLKKANANLETKVKERTEKLKVLAITDSMTGLFNHAYFLKILKKYIENSEIEKFSLIMSDLDNFKKINDTYGHPVGDEVLIQFSRIIKKNIKGCDIAGRYGGEEFVILLTECELENAIKIADKIRKDLFQYRFKDIDKEISSSFGVCEWKGEDLITLIKKADNFLYKAKISGKNCIKY